MPTVTFLPTFLNDTPLVVDVSAGTTLLEAAEEVGAPMGDACGGNCACSTCHVYVIKGYDDLEEMDDDEDDILGKADDVRMESRLGCQAIIGEEDVLIQISREGQSAFINEHPEHRGREDDIIVP